MNTGAYNPTEYWLARGAHYCDEPRLRSAFYRDQEAFIVDVVKYLGARSILSVGCGFGRVELALAKAIPGIDILATDISEEQLAEGRRRCGNRVRFEVADLYGELPAGHYDLTLAIEVFLHHPHVQHFVEKLLALSPTLMHEFDPAVNLGDATAPHCFAHDYHFIYDGMGLKAQALYSGAHALMLVSGN